MLRGDPKTKAASWLPKASWRRAKFSRALRRSHQARSTTPTQAMPHTLHTLTMGCTGSQPRQMPLHVHGRKRDDNLVTSPSSPTCIWPMTLGCCFCELHVTPRPSLAGRTPPGAVKTKVCHTSPAPPPPPFVTGTIVRQPE